LSNAVIFPIGIWAEPKPKLNVVHFSFKRCALVATILIISTEGFTGDTCFSRRPQGSVVHQNTLFSHHKKSEKNFGRQHSPLPRFFSLVRKGHPSPHFTLHTLSYSLS